MTRVRGRSRRGTRLHASAPFGHWGTQTFIAGLRCDGLVAPWVLNGPMNRLAFNAYIRTQLAPLLQPGDVVILDNLAAHKSPEARAILAERGVWFLFLPAYSPDLNPIEMAFSKLKALLRKTKARTSRRSGMPSETSAISMAKRNVGIASLQQDMDTNKCTML